jgi:hypothetical protein
VIVYSTNSTHPAPLTRATPRPKDEASTTVAELQNSRGAEAQADGKTEE